MRYEDILISRLEKNLDKWFTSKNFKISKLEKVKENINFDGKINTITYKCYLEDTKTSKTIFIKYFDDWLWKEYKRGIIETQSFNKHREHIKTPKIYDVFEDINSVVLEGVEGKKLSLIFMIYLSPILRYYYRNKINSSIKKISNSIAYLQKITKQKKVKLIDAYDFKVEDIFNEKDDSILKKTLNDFQKLKKLREYLKDQKVLMTKSFNDLKLGNILISNSDIKIIDFFPLKNRIYFENLIGFSISLELTQRIQYFDNRLFLNLRNLFYDEYQKAIPWELDLKLLNKIELLKKSKLLVYFKKHIKTATFPFNFSMHLDIKYLSNQINKNLSKI